MTKPLEVRTVAEAKRATRRPKTVVVKTLSGANGGKIKVLALDGNSASFSDDFLYVFKTNVKAARKKSREARAAPEAGKPIG